MRPALVIILALIILSFQTKKLEKNKIGKKLAASCTNCHLAYDSNVGPTLLNIRKRRSLDWIYQFTINPMKFVSENSQAREVFNKYNRVQMTAFKLTKSEISSILDYIDNVQQKKK